MGLKKVSRRYRARILKPVVNMKNSMRCMKQLHTTVFYTPGYVNKGVVHTFVTIIDLKRMMILRCGLATFPAMFFGMFNVSVYQAAGALVTRFCS